jgi:hypothetical protein
MKFEHQLDRWLAAGIIDSATADRLRGFEGGPAGDRGVSVAEVLAYIGAVVILTGVGFLVGVEYTWLGAAGRIAVVGLVGFAAGITGLLMERRASDGPGRRARSAAYFAVVPVVFYLVIEALHDSNLFHSYQDGSAAFFIAGAISAAVALGLLLRTRATILALALAISCGDAAAGWVSYQQLQGAAAELTWLAGGVLLAGVAEWLRRKQSGTAAEVLRFAALLPLVVAALVLSFISDGWLEPVAVMLSLAGFGLALVRASAGYAIAGGLGLFIAVNEVGFRHFASQVGFPVVLIVSGLALLGIAGALLRLLPQLRRRPETVAPAPQSETAGVDI